MSANIRADNYTAPLLEETGCGEGGGRWWRKVLDVEEAKNQILFSLPMILTNVFYFMITLVSVMFAGHLGQLELAGATLANSWCTVSGFGFMVGLSGALETLCGQAFGAKNYRLLGIYLQAGSIITILISIIISIIWIYTGPILIFLRQDRDIANAAALYLKYMIPGLFAYGLQQNILRFLQTQSIVMPLIPLAGVPAAIHIGVAYAMVHWSGLGYKGAALAASMSLWLSTIILAVYVVCYKEFKRTWEGLSFEAFHHILETFKLALPSAGMVCLEYWAFEILVILAGMMPNAEVTTSLIAMCVNTEAIAFLSAYGLSAAVSTRVSNELGAGNPDKAKHAMAVTLKLTVVLALFLVLLLVFGHNIWSGLFSDSAVIKSVFASMVPFLAVSIAFDTFQAILSGAVRGCGWQHMAVVANLSMFYLIGMPIAVVLGFKAKLHAKGLWIGLICGLTCQSFALLVMMLRTKWSKLNLSEQKDQHNSGSA